MNCYIPQYAISGTMFFILFANFWIHAYTRRSRSSKPTISSGHGDQQNGAVVSNGMSNGVRKRAVTNGYSEHD